MLRTLSEVQSLDLELDALATERGQTPPTLIATRERHRALQTELQGRRAELDGLRQRLNENELELASLQERRKAAAASALRAASGKEASQYQNQELQFANRLQELEEDTMPLLEEQESRQQGVADLEAQMAALRPELEALEADERARIETLDERVAGLAQRRAALAADVEASLLRQYEQVRRARRGLGVVPVTDGGTCGGCNVRLPIFVVQKVKKGQGITRCPSCGRLLWSSNDG
jgi:uncharacterized protein